MFRSPSAAPSTRGTRPLSDQIRAKVSATEWVPSISDHWRSCSCMASMSASDSVATSAAPRPANHDSAYIRTRRGSAGRLRAWRSQRMWSAAGDSSTLPPRATTAGIPASARAAWTSAASECMPTSTAMSGGSTGRWPSPSVVSGREPSSRRRVTSVTRSA